MHKTSGDLDASDYYTGARMSEFRMADRHCGAAGAHRFPDYPTFVLCGLSEFRLEFSPR